MGCGISTMDGNDAPTGRRRYNGRFRNQHANIAPPIDNNKKYHENVDDDSDDQESTRKDEGLDEERLKEKNYVVDRNDQEERGVNINEGQGQLLEDHNVANDNKINVKNNEEEEINNNYDSDDRFIGPGSPSFREYCIDNDSVDKGSIGEFNDCTESGDSIKSSSDEDSTNEKIRHSNKELEKKERRGRGFRNVMHRGKGRGKKNLLNFACYNSSTQSYAEGSLRKIGTKPT